MTHNIQLTEDDMPTKTIEQIFDRLDVWRHLPSYQLERRADIFFSLYLREVLQQRLSIPINENIIPEFPVRKGEIDVNKRDGNQSYKIDYVVVSEDKSLAILVELKTDHDSLRKDQDTYLNASRALGIQKLVDGVITLSRATTAKNKYSHLINHLEKSGLIKIVNEVADRTNRPKRNPTNITPTNMRTEVVYILPNNKFESEFEAITFEQFGDVVSRHIDPLSQRFSASLKEWSEIKAGTTI